MWWATPAVAIYRFRAAAYNGSITLYVGPKAPAGWESNLVPLPAMRLYGPTEEINKRVFKMNDFELVG